MIKFLLVCIIAYLLYKYARSLVEFAAVVLLVIFVSYGVTEYGEDIINYINELYQRVAS